MTQKYFIGKCGGKDCSWRLHDGTNRTYYCSLDLYMHNCPKKVYENCPHGQTLGQMAEQTRPIMCQWFSHILNKHLSTPWLYQIPFMEWVARHGKTFVYMFLKALLSGEDK